MSQTSYSQTLVVGRAGMLADNGARETLSRVAAVAIPFGCAVVKDSTSDDSVKLPTAAADVTGQGKFQGIARLDLSKESLRDGLPAGYALKDEVACVSRGRLWVVPEQAVGPTDPVYVRFADGIADGTKVQKGAFRKDADGTAQVDTLTPTAVNSTLYWVTIDGRSYQYVGDGSATAAEIVTGFIAAINAETATHGVTATGTVTLILTGVSGVAFKTEADTNMAIVHTTPVAQTAVQVPNARYLTTATAGSPAIVEINTP